MLYLCVRKNEYSQDGAGENLTILKENYANYKPEDLLALYIFTGGIPKYVELFIDKKAFTYNKILNEFFRENSYLLNEGKNVLIEEFGKIKEDSNE